MRFELCRSTTFVVYRVKGECGKACGEHDCHYGDTQEQIAFASVLLENRWPIFPEIERRSLFLRFLDRLKAVSHAMYGMDEAIVAVLIKNRTEPTYMNINGA